MGPKRREKGLRKRESGPLQFSPWTFTSGVLLYSFLVFVAAAYPFTLPWIYLIFFILAMPLRVYDFIWRGDPRGHNAFFLLDFCYLVNLAVFSYFVVYLCVPRWIDDSIVVQGEEHSRRTMIMEMVSRLVRLEKLGAILYALSDGPVACALLAWANAWAFHSQEHTISVLIHLLPGLALFAWMHLPRAEWMQIKLCSQLLKTPETALQFGTCATLSSTPFEEEHEESSMRGSLVWLVLLPMSFYVIWQLFYYIAVEVVMKNVIRKDDYDTSFKCLRRRERRKDHSIWNTLVFNQSWSSKRQVLAYGIFQFFFTLGSLCVFVPTYFVWSLGFLWQVAKFVIPIMNGATYTYSRMIDRAISDGVRSRLHALSIFSMSSGEEHSCIGDGENDCEVDQPNTRTKRTRVKKSKTR
jgi:hypothetical protein